jgi:LmbE family N-acetylglucosaminyl deacetylase
MIEDGASVLWVAPHPDDESIAGSLLALACRAPGNPCTFVLLKRVDRWEAAD